MCYNIFIKIFLRGGENLREIIVNKNDAGQRLDKLIFKLCPQMPTSMLYKSLRKNCVKINGKHAKSGDIRVLEGDVLCLYLKDEFFEELNSDTAFMKLTPQLNIVYEDENILLLDKIQGMCVHEDDRGSAATLIDHIKAYLFKKGEWNPEEENTFTPALANRIDRNTGGIVIAAKTAEALRILNQKIKDRELQKKYLCLVHGHMPKKSGTVSGYILKDENKKQVYVYFAPRPGARSFLTRYRVLEEYSDHSLVEAELETGRTHQIRAGFAAIGHPLLGDGKYGTNEINKRFPYPCQALYSYKLKFTFSSDAGALNYLNGREFEIKNVQFKKK